MPVCAAVAGSMPSWRILILKSCALCAIAIASSSVILRSLVQLEQRLVERLHAVVVALFHRVADQVRLLGVA